MTIQITRVLTPIEYYEMQAEAMAKGWYRNDPRMFTPGMAWYQPFYWDPLGMLQELRNSHLQGNGFNFVGEPYYNHGNPMLSVHYWNDWADKRPPICVVCPNGQEWEIDRKSSNGSGWVVTGELPNIVCSPSIVVPGYHGFLGTGSNGPGWFTVNLDGPEPNGIMRAIPQ